MWPGLGGVVRSGRCGQISELLKFLVTFCSTPLTLTPLGCGSGAAVS